MLISIIISTLHFFVNIFAGGRSNTKVILFILFVLFNSFIIFYFKKNFFISLHKRTQTFFWSSVSLLYAWSLFLFFYFFQTKSLKINDYIVTVSNSEISSSVWYHSHVMKGIVGIVLKFFSVNNLENIDAGNAYLGLLPDWMFIFGFILLCLSLISVVAYILYIKSKVENNSRKEKLVLVLLYSISIFSLVKTSLDGGIFHPDAFISFVTILITDYILNNQNNPDKFKFITQRNVYLYVLALTLLSWILVLKEPIYQILTSHLYILLISILLFLYFKIHEVRYLIFIFLVFSFFASGLDRSIYNYSKLPITKGEPVYVFSYKPPTEQFEIIKTTPIGRGNLYTLVSNENSNIDALAKDIGSMPNVNPVSIPWQTCIPTEPEETYSFIIHTKEKLPETLFSRRELPIRFKLNKVEIKDNWYNTYVSIHTEPCTPRIFNILNEIIQENIKNKPYFLSNLELESE